MNHIHELFGIDKPYVDICREERNFAAMLYHLLLDKDRLKAFLELVGDSTSSIDDVRIYFEYAHLRDLWAAVAAEAKRERKTANLNDRYRKIILRLFCGSTESNQLPTDCKEFNEFFIGKGAKASAQQIQSPSRWQKSQFDTWCKEPFDRKFAERACMLNWAFNAKPDLVLHLGDNRAICIEAKLESKIDEYSIKPARSDRFSMKQTEIQKFIIKDLLGYETRLVVIEKKPNAAKSREVWSHYAWKDVFEAVMGAKPLQSQELAMVSDLQKSSFIQSV